MNLLSILHSTESGGGGWSGGHGWSMRYSRAHTGQQQLVQAPHTHSHIPGREHVAQLLHTRRRAPHLRVELGERVRVQLRSSHCVCSRGGRSVSGWSLCVSSRSKDAQVPSNNTAAALGGYPPSQGGVRGCVLRRDASADPSGHVRKPPPSPLYLAPYNPWQPAFPYLWRW